MPSSMEMSLPADGDWDAGSFWTCPRCENQVCVICGECFACGPSCFCLKPPVKRRGCVHYPLQIMLFVPKLVASGALLWFMLREYRAMGGTYEPSCEADNLRTKKSAGTKGSCA